MDRASPKVLALLAGLTLAWGTNWSMFSIALSELPVLTFRTGSLTVAVIVLYALMRLRGDSFAAPRDRWLALVAASMMNLTV